MLLLLLLLLLLLPPLVVPERCQCRRCRQGRVVSAGRE